jgi:hypothetical protein
MKRDLPLYDIVIDLDDDETTVSFNSLVSNPAHEKNFETFAKKVSYNFNDEEQMITGVAISANTPIFRRDPSSGEEYYVNFSKQSIKDIVFDYARKENFNNVNLEHDSKRVVSGIYMTLSYIIDESNGFTAPKRFENETDGSWIVGYKVTDKKVYEAAKDGLFNGFSIEGVFLLLDTGKGFDHEFMQIYEELKQVQEYISFYNDYPEAVSNNAKKGIELNTKYGNKCATRVGRLRATTLAGRKTLSIAVIKRMYSYLSRAETYYDESDESACGTISFLLWGGLAGKRWSEAKLKELGIFEQ